VISGRVIAIVAAALAVAAPARAQDDGTATTTLTISDALSRADAHAPDVAVAAAQAAVAHRDVDVAGILPNPRIGGGTSVDYVGILDLYVLLPIFGQLDTAADAARARATVADDAIEVARLDARLAVALAWTDLWLAERNAALADGDRERRQRVAEAADARLEEGSVSRIDSVRARADAARADADAAAATTAVRAASARLAGTIGGDPLTTTLSTSGDPLGTTVDLDGDVDAALEAHPVARRAAAGVIAAEESSEHDHRSRWPRLGVQVSDWIHRSNDQHDVRVMLTMDLALFDEPRISRGDALREQSHAEEDAALARLRAALVATRADYAAVAERCRAQSEIVLPMTQEAAELAQAGYEEGSVDLTTVLAAAQSLADAERSLATCLADRARAAARLDHAEGRADDWR
jgi:cobalt-zinc-cadmium efflux system outer membrane protein